MKKKFKSIFAAATLVLFSGSVANAHYGMIIPSDQMVMQGEDSTISLDVRFWHPMEGIAMPLEKPAKFNVIANGQKSDILGSLKSQTSKDMQTWGMDYKIKRPGLYVFTMEPQPYWEPSEDKFIVHHTKVVVTSYGNDEGWDEEVGLKTEITPLAKPFGQYTGNVFQGIVKMDGAPVPYSEVEIEYYNEDGSKTAPTDYMVTQTIKADGNGVFTYAVPSAGWWGFAALNDADFKIKYEGKDKDVELGAVLWVKFQDMK